MKVFGIGSKIVQADVEHVCVGFVKRDGEWFVKSDKDYLFHLSEVESLFVA